MVFGQLVMAVQCYAEAAFFEANNLQKNGIAIIKDHFPENPEVQEVFGIVNLRDCGF